MKAVLFSALIATAFSATAKADDHAQLADQARAAYSMRDFSNTGISRAQEAANLYEKAATVAPDQTVKAKYLVARSESLFFVGNASTARDVKIDRHLKGMEAADQGVKLLGLSDVPSATDAALQSLKSKLSKEQLDLVGEGLYQRGINLGQWGAANGVVDSLSKWPELRRNMEIIDALGLTAIHDYGAFRVLGRGYFKIPSLLGGSMKKATHYLGTALEKTKSPGQIFSRNGFNNIYFAEVLKENGEDEKAVELLEAFIKADPAAVNPEAAIETKENQREAAELLKSW